MNGKILFFNATDGKGIIITSEKKKLSFEVNEWEDFDIMPSLGLEVSFDISDDTPKAIVATENYTHAPKSENTEKENIEEENISIENDSPSEEEYPLDPALDALDDAPDEEAAHEEKPFEKDVNIEEIKEFEEELPEREESVTVSLNVNKAVQNYFNIIKENIKKREVYKKVDGRLDYLLIRRFLWTIYNNLSEIDIHIITPQMHSLALDLKEMARVYDDFIVKTKHPKLAYAEVFLSCQAEYQKIKHGAELTVERINRLKGNEQYVGAALKVKKKDLEEAIDTEEFELLTTELKSLKGTYVDTVHMMAELDERYKHDMALLKEFEKEYREDFYALFNSAATKYKDKLVDILSAQAFILDDKLWNKAKFSKAVKAHFQKASIVGEFNTRTYLKYYLKSFNNEKMSEEMQKLSTLYEYLCSIHKEYVLIVVNNSQDAMEYESTIKGLDKTIYAKSFIDEMKALKWAIKNSVKILVLEDRLSQTSIDVFLKYYKKYILSVPKIIILGQKPKTHEYPITKLLGKNVAPMILAKNVKELYNESCENTKEDE